MLQPAAGTAAAFCYNRAMDRNSETGARVLLVEDDESIAESIEYNLKKQGFSPLRAGDGLEGLRLLRRMKPDLLILDLMLPSLDGWKLCEQARQEGFDLPIIILSARTSEFDKVQCLSLGADDYMTKPFGMQELLARVSAHLRRARSGPAEPAGRLEAGPITIDPSRKEAFTGGVSLGLTPKEFALLLLLVRKSPAPVSREQIYRGVWGYEMLHGDRAVDVFVRRLRKKLAERLPEYRFLHTHHGFGYRFEVKS
jgi:DNA-binding response OmpR family regulator